MTNDSSKNYSPPPRRGVDAPSEAKAQTGWSDRRNVSAELTTPALRATPPLRGGECLLIPPKLPSKTASPPNFLFTYKFRRPNMVLQTTIRGILNDQTSESRPNRFKLCAGIRHRLCTRSRATSAIVHADNNTLGKASGLERRLANDGR